MPPLTQSRNTTILPVLIALTLGCFGLSPQARALCRQGCDFIHANAFLGDEALSLNTTGSANTAIGFEALSSNTTGFFNTANGSQALQSNTTGNSNTANGVAALLNNTTGNDNTATGAGALVNNTTGTFNTVTGVAALNSNTTGFNNTANGWHALQFTTGSNNIAVGAEAGINLTSGNNNIDIGNAGVAAESKTIRIGTRGTQRNTFIAGISGITVANGVGVIIDNNGHLGTIVSSQRFKTAIKPIDKTSEAILALNPVTFRYKHELDPEGIPQFGLVAEDVEKVNPDLVARDEQGKVYSVRYEAVNAMLLNEFLKEHRKVEEQTREMREQKTTIGQLKTTVAKQEATVARQQKQIEALTAGLQKVSAQIEASQTAPQVVNNNL